LWTRGFSGGAFRKLENIGTTRAATIQLQRDVVQRIFTGSSAQLWALRAP
jgi:hypothetical protein